MSEPATAATVVRVAKICNQRGLHARAAAKFVQCANGFTASVAVARDGTRVSGQSIMGLMMLAAAKGCDIEISAIGSDAEAAVSALCQLVESGFDEK